MWTGVLHGIYGLGGFASPLVATAMVSRGIPVKDSCYFDLHHANPCLQYHLFYTTNVAMTLVVFVLAFIAFRNLHTLPHASLHESQPTETTTSLNAFTATLRSRAVWTLAIFLMLYVG